MKSNKYKDINLQKDFQEYLQVCIKKNIECFHSLKHKYVLVPIYAFLRHKTYSFQTAYNKIT